MPQQLALVDESDRKHALVAFPITLEEWLMEGCYNRILSNCKSCPSPYYTQFMARLENTVRCVGSLPRAAACDCVLTRCTRGAAVSGVVCGVYSDEIADCSAASYEVLAISSLQQLMMLPSRDAVVTYVSVHRPTWGIEGDNIRFVPVVKAKLEVPAMALIGSLLSYATELERIV
jgi:hypothetical protein